MNTGVLDDKTEEFIARWSKSSGAERANFQGFAYELCDVLGVPRPDVSVDDAQHNTYAFERSVEFKEPDGSKSLGRIDLYKKGAFVLEAKQSRQKGGKKELKLKTIGQADFFVPDAKPQGQRSANRAWDALMLNAYQQATEYARALPASDGWPPFILICDVGHCMELYADFTGQGKNYTQFPDRKGFRIFLEDLRNPEIRERLRQVWDEPLKLDPTRRSAKVTRDIAKRLAEVSKGLEAREHNTEDVAHFLMRCLFTMFAEDVKLLPEGCFTRWLEQARTNTSKFKHELAQLWQAMDKGGYATIAETEVRRFNGSFFKSATVLDLQREEIGELLAASKSNWKEVDPAIFGTLLEQALSNKERAKLGAHYTPRAYVERLVVVTVMEPLRQEWAQVQATAERLKEEKRGKDAIKVVREFHDKICATRVLDPACGTGNFLFVALEQMKRLEGEVLEAILDLGGQEALALENQIDPHQFLGMEKNERAAAIAELVIWLGYLQWYFRTQKGMPNDPVLRDFKNIKVMDAVLTWDGYPVPKVETKDGKQIETYPNARKPAWDDAEFIVGNPPFIGGGLIRSSLGDSYTEALWAAHGDINDSADFVMYWWDRAAKELTRRSTQLVRFGFVTTNSIAQPLSGARVVAKHIGAKKPISLLMAIPDHPWTKVTENAAAVRIAMTVAAAGRNEGALREVIRESDLNTDEPCIELSLKIGHINSDLTIGADVKAAEELRASAGICHDGVKLHGKGFIVSESQARMLGLGKRSGLEKYIRPYRNGRDLAGTPRGVMVIDLFGLTADYVRQHFPEVYQHVLAEVRDKVEIDKKNGERKLVGRKWNNRESYRTNWWIFGEPRTDLRPALVGLRRHIGTVDTARHRVFQFLEPTIICDDKVVVVASEDARHLGILSSRIHAVWALRAGGWLGQGNDAVYNKSRCFDPFPFPDCPDSLEAKIRDVAEDLDAHRKARQAEHPGLTLTQMYNVLEKIRANEMLDENDKHINTQGLVLILKELHDKLDVLVFEAYGWPQTLDDDEILERLVTLNAERAKEERSGKVRWLRPEYQRERFGSEAEKATAKAERDDARTKARQEALNFDDDLQEMKPEFPTENELAETASVMRILAFASEPLSIQHVARHFKQGLKVEKRVASTISALARLGQIVPSDDGATFSVRRT